MKKILFLLMVCLIKLNAYEYLVYNRTGEVSNPSSTIELIFYTEYNSYLRMKQVYYDDHFSYNNNLFPTLNNIKFQSRQYYVSKEIFDSYYKNDLVFLNDLYTKTSNINYFLNYLYNENEFTATNYIDYANYELLYNSDGLVVESIVNGVWAGLYDGPDHSGYLYDEKGDLKYINGVSPLFFESSFNKLMRRFGINLQSIFIRQIFYPLLVLIFSCVVFRSVIRMAFKAFLIRFYDRKIGQLQKRREGIEDA